MSGLQVAGNWLPVPVAGAGCSSKRTPCARKMLPAPEPAVDPAVRRERSPAQLDRRDCAHCAAWQAACAHAGSVLFVHAAGGRAG